MQNWAFFAYVISGEQSANRPKQLRNDVFHVKTRQSAKITMILQKMEITQKATYIPFFARRPSTIIIIIILNSFLWVLTHEFGQELNGTWVVRLPSVLM